MMRALSICYGDLPSGPTDVVLLKVIESGRALVSMPVYIDARVVALQRNRDE